MIRLSVHSSARRLSSGSAFPHGPHHCPVNTSATWNFGDDPDDMGPTVGGIAAVFAWVVTTPAAKPLNTRTLTNATTNCKPRRIRPLSPGLMREGCYEPLPCSGPVRRGSAGG